MRRAALGNAARVAAIVSLVAFALAAGPAAWAKGKAVGDKAGAADKAPPAAAPGLIQIDRYRPVPAVEARLGRDDRDGYNLWLKLDNYRLTPGRTGQAPRANEGHAVLFINGVKVYRLYSTWTHLPRALFRDGFNYLRVTLNANNHAVWAVGRKPIQNDVVVDTRARTGPPIVFSAVRYRLTWRWGTAKPLKGGGWRTVNDLGYTIRVTGGQIVTRSIQLRPCHHTERLHFGGLLRMLLGISAAHAGHDLVRPDISSTVEAVAESLKNPTATVASAPRAVTTPAYCFGHMVFARTGKVDPATGRAGVSLKLTGRYRKGSSGKWTPFTLESVNAFGSIYPLVSAKTGKPIKALIPKGYTITIERRLDSLFSGVDFVAMANIDAAYKVLENAATLARFVVEKQPPPAR